MVIFYVPCVLSGWRLEPPFFGLRIVRWIGAALFVLPMPILLDFLVRFVREGHGAPVPLAPPQRLVVKGAFRFVGLLLLLMLLRVRWFRPRFRSCSQEVDGSIPFSSTILACGFRCP